MISLRLAARVLCASLGFVLLAGSARAQYTECPLPQDIPGEVYMSILDQADTYFGGVTQKTCDSIVKTGLATCKAQVKAAFKCGVRTANSNYEILVKQCAELTDATERANCKDGAKTLRDYNVDGYRGSMDDEVIGGLVVCDTTFVASLSSACMSLALKVGGP